MISKICRNFKVLIYKSLQMRNAMIAKDKVFRKLKEIQKYFVWQMDSVSFLTQRRYDMCQNLLEKESVIVICRANGTDKSFALPGKRAIMETVNCRA